MSGNRICALIDKENRTITAAIDCTKKDIVPAMSCLCRSAAAALHLSLPKLLLMVQLYAEEHVKDGERA